MTALSMALCEILVIGAAKQALREIGRTFVPSRRPVAARPAGHCAPSSPGRSKDLGARAKQPLLSAAGLNDHLLSDIGLSRAQVTAAHLVGRGREA